MPKLIDSEKLLECLIAEMKEFDCDTSSHYSRGRYDAYEWVTARINSGTFDPTPVQPDIKPGDKVRTNTAWKHLEGVVTGLSKYHAMVDFGFPTEFEIPLEQLEVITDEN